MHSNALLGLGTLLVSASLVGCGHGVAATQTSSNSTNKQDAMLKYSQCMRAHGVSDFPDPQTSAGGGTALRISGGPGSDLSPDNPTFQHAQQACKSQLPNGGQLSPQQQQQMQQQALAFSQCMRSHGVTDFPDPQFQSGGGGVGIRIGGANGKGGPGDLNPDDPTFQSAQRACQSQLGKVLPGGGPKTSTGGGGNSGFSLQVGG
jgi:hypothetical protein